MAPRNVPRILGMLTFLLVLAIVTSGNKTKGCAKVEPAEPVCNSAADCVGMQAPIDCDGTWSCELGDCKFTCGPPTCETDNDCEKGEMCAWVPCPECKAGVPCTCPKTCQPAPQECISDTDCPAGTTCQCVPPTACPGCLWLCIGQCLAEPFKPLQWHITCGTPVCGSYAPKPGVPPCTGEVQGDACTAAGQTCDLVGDPCNQMLQCAAEDPKQFGCPKSQAEAKDDIRYLDDAELQRTHRELQDIRLARYAYKDDPTRKQHLGFIIDDGVPDEVLWGSRDRVDLYGYLSMTVAAIKVQSQQIEELKHTVAELHSIVTDLEASHPGPMCLPRNR